MMKKINILLIFLILLSVSCTKDFDDFNSETKNPTVTEGEFLFSNAQKELMDQISSTNVNLNVWKMFSQYWTETTYVDEANYDIKRRSIPDRAFRSYYRSVLKPLDEATTLISEDPITATETEAQKANKLAIIELLKVYSYHNLVNIFGDVPYTEAIDIDNISPKYDDAATIYADLITRINNAVSSMDDSEASFVSADFIYGGDVSSWITFANSLKLKIAINVADAADLSFDVGSVVEEAVIDGVFSSSTANALFPYESGAPNNNPLNSDLVLSGRKDFVVANTIVDIMNDLNDPRRDDFFSNQIEGAWLGGPYGDKNPWPSYSHIHDNIKLGDFPGILMTYSEIQFYIAEAAARGYSVVQTAEEAYNEAVTASFLFWGGTSIEAGDYLTDYAIYDATNWKESIGTQSWLASYTRGFIGYTTYRRLDYPIMNVAVDGPATGGPVPTRFTYPINEQTLNTVNYDAAAEAIGGDDLLTKIFWDIY